MLWLKFTEGIFSERLNEVGCNENVTDTLFNSGGGIVMAGGVDSVVQLADQLQAPVCTTYLHNDAFPKSHKLWMGKILSLNEAI